ncbi:hypothetical protein D3C87_339590 [compost metagenome]
MDIDMLFPDQNRHVRHLLGLYIKRKRNDLGVSIQDTASNMSLDSQAYRRIEAGRSKITPEQFQHMHHLLALEPNELIEIRKIAGVKYINDLSRVLSPNYPNEEQ